MTTVVTASMHPTTPTLRLMVAPDNTLVVVSAVDVPKRLEDGWRPAITGEELP